MRPDYFDHYPTIEFERTERGVLTMRLHSDHGPVIYSEQHHADWCGAFYEVGADRDNRIVIITGTGDAFIDKYGWTGTYSRAADWDDKAFEGRRMIRNYLDIEVPIIAAVNGPASIHNELAVLADIVLAATTATFSDAPHFPNRVPPGDGIQVIWQLLLGINRGRYFLLTGQELCAREALELGVVSEVLEPEALIPRANELAQQLAKVGTMTLRMSKAALVQDLKRLMDQQLTSSITMEGMAVMDMLMKRQKGDQN